jgi:hypothetical protein
MKQTNKRQNKCMVEREVIIFLMGGGEKSTIKYSEGINIYYHNE